MKRRASQVAPMVKSLPASAADVRDAGSIPGTERSPGGGHGNPLQYSCLENPMDRGAWKATGHSVTKSWTRLKRLSMCKWKFYHQASFLKMQMYYLGWRGILSFQIKLYLVSTLWQSSPGFICTNTSPGVLLGLAALISYLNVWELWFSFPPQAQEVRSSAAGAQRCVL